MSDEIVELNINIVWHTIMIWTPTLSYKGSRYNALADAIERAIEVGELHPGDQMPPQRDIAWKLGLDTSTVTKAYREASRRHLIHGEVGRGTFVLGRSRAAEMFLSRNRDGAILDLSVNRPAAINDGSFKASVVQAISTEVTDLEGYPSHDLVHRLRLAGVKWLASRSIRARPDEVIPVPGGQAALAAILSVLDVKSLGIEEQTYSGIIALARARSLATVDLAMDQSGVLPAALVEAKVDAAILVPTLHNPSGIIWPESRRRDLLIAAARSGTVLVEDDAYGPLSDAQPLAAMESDASMLFTTTLSKTVAAGLRIGFIWGKGPLIEKLNAATYATSWAMSPLMMEIAIRLIEGDTASDRIAWQRQEIAARHRLATTIFPQLRGLPASPHIFIRTDARPVLFERAGIRIAPASAFSRKADADPGIRISLSAAPSRSELAAALQECAKIINGYSGG